MLERLTPGRYLSALHRAKNLSARERLSMVLFLDPSFDAKLVPLPNVLPGHEPSRTRTCAGIASTRTRCRALTASTCSAKSRKSFRSWHPPSGDVYGLIWARISPPLCAALFTLTYSSPAL